MSRYLITRWPNVVNISSQPHVYIERTDYHQDYDMYNGINLLTTYPGVLGLKTGYTPVAGLTLVTLARRGDKEVLGVLLGAVNRRDDAKSLLDYSFKNLGLEI
jgi:D-alanyl-D-alanine carboxypeptidase